MFGVLSPRVMLSHHLGHNFRTIFRLLAKGLSGQFFPLEEVSSEGFKYIQILDPFCRIPGIHCHTQMCEYLCLHYHKNQSICLCHLDYAYIWLFVLLNI